MELIEHCKNAKGWKYVYGAKGRVYTYKEIQALRDMYGDMVWNTDLNKNGYTCCDCSGLISSCTGVIRSSSNFYTTAVDRVSIEELKKNWNKYIGWGIWHQGHIGVVSDTEGYYYAMENSKDNWVHRPITYQKWTYAIKLCDINYTDSPIKGNSKGIENQVIKVDYAQNFDVADSGKYKLTKSAYLRVGAGTKKGIIETIPKGNTVRCYGYSTTKSRTKWLYVTASKNGNSYNGFITLNKLERC